MLITERPILAGAAISTQLELVGKVGEHNYLQSQLGS
jgi:bacterioferritin (cytochrome b1)